jgi:hypothetical protein
MDKMVDIKCLVCKESLVIPPYIDPADYDGQLFCHECNLLWNVRFKSSKVVKYKLAEKQPKAQPSKIIVKMGIPPYDESLRAVKGEGEK